MLEQVEYDKVRGLKEIESETKLVENLCLQCAK